MEAFIGTITLFAGNYEPQGWAFCKGQELPIDRYTAMYSILGTMYGGDGKRTFALPNMPTIKDVDGLGESRYIICLEGYYPVRSY